MVFDTLTRLNEILTGNRENNRIAKEIRGIRMALE